MKEGTIKYQLPLKKGMEHFPRKRKKLVFDSIIRANYKLDASLLDITWGSCYPYLFYFIFVPRRTSNLRKVRFGEVAILKQISALHRKNS
jgi:hypothetical protein